MNAQLVINNSNTNQSTRIKIENKGSRSCIDPEHIWADITQRIKEIKDGEWDCDYDRYKLTYSNFIKTLLYYDNYTKIKDLDMSIDNVKYYLTLDWYDTVVVFKAYHSGNESQQIVCYENRYVIDDNNEGNCIDDFIKRGVNPQIENIQDLVSSINSRLPERQIAIEYHNTGCYERDFTEISLIKKFAQKIVDNCNMHLERISDFYTRL